MGAVHAVYAVFSKRLQLVLDLIGAGGTLQVYTAEMGSQEVAVKTISTQLLCPEGIGSPDWSSLQKVSLRYIPPCHVLASLPAYHHPDPPSLWAPFQHPDSPCQHQNTVLYSGKGLSLLWPR